MQFKPEPKVIYPFRHKVFKDLQRHITEVRRLFDWPGIAIHDKDAPDDSKFNRWFWHNLPLLVKLHNEPEFIRKVSKHFGLSLKPSYAFLSMYDKTGVCPLHTDRPQCQFTVDLLVNSNHKNRPWPIYIDGKECKLTSPGEGLAYSGTGQKHYRNPMDSESDATKVDLAFFHFVPIEWQGALS
jgi:hypothetical protein